MSDAEIDAYLAGVDEPGRSTLAALRATLVALLPDAEPGLAYGAPAFRVGGKAVAGFAAYARHLSYLPHSGSVLATVADADPSALAGYETSKGALTFPLDEPLPRAMVETLVAARLAELTPT